MEGYKGKKEQLQRQMEGYAASDVAIAFSGGVDSTLLLKMACEVAARTGTKVYALTMRTRLHPMGEIRDAERICQAIGAEHIVIGVDELKEAGIMDNPVERCYLCKKHLFTKMLERAAALGAKKLLDGTNEDDLHVYRPGIKALRELGIDSPLALAGLTKAEVREMAAQYGLDTASKPSMPCLATRFPYGTSLDYEKLAQVEKGETYLKRFGFRNVRIRVHGDIARIEVDEPDLGKLLSHGKEIAEQLKKLGFIYITLDLEGFRSGSMDVGIMV